MPDDRLPPAAPACCSACCLSLWPPPPACSPFVVHLKPSIAELAKEYQAKGVKVLAISSNSVETHPQVGWGGVGGGGRLAAGVRGQGWQGCRSAHLHCPL